MSCTKCSHDSCLNCLLHILKNHKLGNRRLRFHCTSFHMVIELLQKVRKILSVEQVVVHVNILQSCIRFLCMFRRRFRGFFFFLLYFTYKKTFWQKSYKMWYNPHSHPPRNKLEMPCEDLAIILALSLVLVFLINFTLAALVGRCFNCACVWLVIGFDRTQILLLSISLTHWDDPGIYSRWHLTLPVSRSQMLLWYRVVAVGLHVAIGVVIIAKEDTKGNFSVMYAGKKIKR